MTTFVPGRELNRRFYREAVAPILRSQFRGVPHSAALLGAGSEVLGYDTELSMDHDWGPRAQLFLTTKDCRRYRVQILRELGMSLPREFDGLPTRFTEPDADNARVRVPASSTSGTPIIWIGTIRDYFREYVHVDIARRLSDLDWLVIPSQKLLTLSKGQIFHDDLGLSRVRARFDYYPRDVWLHLLAVQWLRISEEEAFVGRTGAVGDELGSRLIAARQVREIMRLAFLLDRTYYPYDKWLGTAFRGLRLAKPLEPLLKRALEAKTIRLRVTALSEAYEVLAKRQNALGIHRPLPTKVSRFHDRPYLVIHAGDFAAATRRGIRSRRVREYTRLGSIDQFGSTEELGSRRQQLPALRAVLRA
jgi:hypothetical protein